MLKTNIYIDGNNLYKSFKTETEQLDYLKFHKYLQDKYKPAAIYLFTGRIPGRETFYNYLSGIGYALVFKETFRNKAGEIKGNVDAELMLQAVSQAYESPYDNGVLVSGDGDFACLIPFWQRRDISPRILIPKLESSSYFLRKLNIPLVFLDSERLKPRFVMPSKRKSP